MLTLSSAEALAGYHNKNSNNLKIKSAGGGGGDGKREKTGASFLSFPFPPCPARFLFLSPQPSYDKGNPKNPDLDFLIEIHPENGFLGAEIRFWISRSIGKSGFRF